MYNYAVLICTHGRPHAQYTLEALRTAGYHGRIILVTDDEDKTYNDYFIQYGNGNTYNAELVQFDKQHYIDYTDTGVLEPKRKAILYAKCACEDFAKMILGLEAFIIADDDLTGFRYRYEEGNSLKSLQITHNLDKILDSYIDYIIESNICAASFGTSQMFMGGTLSAEKKGENRIPFNFVFRNVSIPFTWRSEIYEDSISAIREGEQGKYMFQIPHVQIEMKPLYAGANGGMTDLYNNVSAFEKVFPVIKYLPSCAKLSAGKDKIIYSILKNNAVPKLISSSYRKSC